MKHTLLLLKLVFMVALSIVEPIGNALLNKKTSAQKLHHYTPAKVLSK